MLMMMICHDESAAEDLHRCKLNFQEEMWAEKEEARG